MVTPAQAIDRIQGVYGAHAGARTLHAKGRFFRGTFTATPEAAALCRSGHLQGQPVPVWVRWSNGVGHPRSKDGAPDVRGMAVSFRLADGTATDLLGQTAPRFPVRTPESFVRLVEASNKPASLPLFLLRNPSAVPALAANAKALSLVPPRSFAEASYFPIHGYAWTAADGSTCWVRYQLLPQDAEAARPEGEFTGRDRLFEEIEARLAVGPARFTLRVQVAGEGDDPHDPMSVWSRDGRAFDAGTIEVTAPDPEREQDGEVVVFDPTRVVDGIGLSDDPILRFRPAAYSESVNRRIAPAEEGV
jgi:catalase